MIDFFALFDEPRRPWLDPDALKKKFLALSAQFHPDRLHNASKAEKQAGQQRYADLNAGYNCLREPRERVRHLLELERGAKPQNVQQVPPDLMNTFLEVSALCREADGFLAKKEGFSSPLLKVQLFEASQTITEKLMIAQQQLNSWQEKLVGLLKALDEQWMRDPFAAHRQTMLPQLEELYYVLSYLSRWRGQIQERLVQLTL